jgi:hypothetical protein
VDTTESAEAVTAALDKALSSDSVLTLTDARGRQVVIPARHVAYLEIGSSTVGQVGFRG